MSFWYNLWGVNMLSLRWLLLLNSPYLNKSILRGESNIEHVVFSVFSRVDNRGTDDTQIAIYKRAKLD